MHATLEMTDAMSMVTAHVPVHRAASAWRCGGRTQDDSGMRRPPPFSGKRRGARAGSTIRASGVRPACEAVASTRMLLPAALTTTRSLLIPHPRYQQIALHYTLFAMSDRAQVSAHIHPSGAGRGGPRGRGRGHGGRGRGRGRGRGGVTTAGGDARSTADATSRTLRGRGRGGQPREARAERTPKPPLTHCTPHISYYSHTFLPNYILCTSSLSYTSRQHHLLRMSRVCLTRHALCSGTHPRRSEYRLQLHRRTPCLISCYPWARSDCRHSSTSPSLHARRHVPRPIGDIELGKHVKAPSHLRGSHSTAAFSSGSDLRSPQRREASRSIRQHGYHAP